MKRQRTIAVVTGTRAELGLLAPVMHAIKQQAKLRLRVVVAGLHLTTGTWRSVQADWGLSIDAKVSMQQRGQSGREADVAAIGRGVTGFGRTFAEVQPSVVLVLGDRVEAFAAATAASIGGIHVAHIHGGDRAEGVADEAMRHAISKLAHLHYPATALSRRRLLRMGESTEHVVRVGSPAVDELLQQQRKLRRDPKHLIVMQHPVGGSTAEEKRWMKQTLAAADAFAREQSGNTDVLIFDPNADPGSDGIQQAINERIPNRTPRGGQAGRYHNWRYLPRGGFLAKLHHSIAIVGNSSAGLIESAVLKVPCVNIGPRQSGRERTGNVIDCDYGKANVLAALRQASQLDLRRLRHPYGQGDTAQRIAHHLANVDLAAISLNKRNAY
ncbi:UDP-N-acetylglucosamine 2-epimerase [Phycisphaerales bacterium AB-hyl4]|uniref:UDP-N-acetylglucosamine 2-epimerase n=1 Tax=Natronomicrosphaera hydrolytica TaxID=3242702 RepID=A0ABV4U106_9BACT